MKDIDLKVLANKLKQLKDENVTIRMQLLDPYQVKRTADPYGFHAVETKKDLVEL